MRFDLTQAAFRVLERAGLCVLPDSPSEITAAKLLISLLEEEDCRAADWLSQEGITPEIFRGDFGIGECVPAKKEKRYSVYKGYHPAEYSSNQQQKARFYLDDQQIKINRLAKELESAFEIVAAQCSHYSVRQGRSLEERRQIPLHLGIMSVSTLDGNFTSGGLLATEHLLLASAMDEQDIGQYLREHNFDTAALFDRIAKQNQQHFFGYFEVEEVNTSSADNFPPLEGQEQSEEALTLTASAPSPERELISFSARESGESGAAFYRLLDAAANRARESCRVIEDYVRFILNLPELTQTLKSFRHRLQNILSELPFTDLLAARDTVNDIGTLLEAEGEYRRTSTEDVLAANFSRLQESLRTLEEFSKIVVYLSNPSAAKQFEQLRYESYTLQKSIPQKTLRKGGSEKPSDEIINGKPAFRVLSEARFYILLDCRKDTVSFCKTVNVLINGGADVIQLRDKTADDRTLLERGKLLRQLIDVLDRKALFIMNDRPDLAVLTNADGVHIGQDELPVAEVRRIVKDKLIGVSTHSAEQVRRAVADGADYIGVGPVFSSSTKNFTKEELAGLELLREVSSEELPIPAFAIGGITADNLDEVLQTGIKCIAVSSAVINADNPQEIAKEFTKRLNTSQTEQ